MTEAFDSYLDKYESSASAEEKALLHEYDLRFAIARQLLFLRKEGGLTQIQLAEAVGIDQAEISRIERGAGNPTVETLQRIADVFPGVQLGFVRAGHLVEAG